MGIGAGWDLPPGSEPWTNFHWFQASTRGSILLVLLSQQPVWYTGHYVCGRMMPCIGEECEFCKSGIGAQIRYCFGVAEDATRRVGLIEFGQNNGQLLRDWAYRLGGLRGMSIEVEKHSRSAQSRTVVTFVDRPSPIWTDSAECPDVELALYLTWHKCGATMPRGMQERMEVRLRPGRTRTG
jgi:hypothetical protein